MHEVIIDYKSHQPGERELVDWTRPDGIKYRNVPVCYLRKVTEADYLQQFPHMQGRDELKGASFWEVSVD